MSWTSVKELPDADITVLARVQDEENPICVAFLDGDDWREAGSADPIEKPVTGWMHLDQAAKILDRGRNQ